MTEASKRANLKWRIDNRQQKDHYDHSWRKRRRLLLVELMGAKCTRCGYNEHPAALDFDHVDPEQKLFTISDHLNYAWHRLLAEIAKCRLLCANCHRVRTYAPEMF